MHGRKLLLTPLRQLGSEEMQPLTDMIFDRNQYHLLAYVAKSGIYLPQDVEFRGDMLLASKDPCTENRQALTEKEMQPEHTAAISYTQLLRKQIYDEEGALLGMVGDVEVDLCRKKLCSIWLSGGIWEDLCFGRRRLDVLHLKNMQKEWEEE